MKLRALLYWVRLELAQRLLPAEPAEETWPEFGAIAGSSMTPTGPEGSGRKTRGSPTSSHSQEGATPEDEESPESRPSLEAYFTCSECGRPQEEEPEVIGFREMGMIEFAGGQRPVWVPSMKALCTECIEGVRKGVPAKRPDGERTSAIKNTPYPLGFQAPSTLTEEEGTEVSDEPVEAVKEVGTRERPLAHDPRRTRPEVQTLD